MRVRIVRTFLTTIWNALRAQRLIRIVRGCSKLNNINWNKKLGIQGGKKTKSFIGITEFLTMRHFSMTYGIKKYVESNEECIIELGICVLTRNLPCKQLGSLIWFQFYNFVTTTQPRQLNPCSLPHCFMWFVKHANLRFYFDCMFELVVKRSLL